MNQKLVLPLAQLFKNNYPGNKYYGWERLRELAVAGIKFAIKSSHRNGSCDDYFPYEQAMGALVYSTYALTESYQLLSLEDKKIIDFFKLRGDYIIKHNEAGQLANHQALAALALYNIYLLSGDQRYKKASEDKVGITLQWQNHDEGWFQEYEGADPGYHTCTIDSLAKLYQKSSWDSLVEPLIKAVDFAWHFMHPDGSYAGEYGSRNTYLFYPHGFEIMARFTMKAAEINDLYLDGVVSDKRGFNDDDRMCSHFIFNWLQAYEDYWPIRCEGKIKNIKYEKWYPGAGLFIKGETNYHAVCNLKKGGVIKLHNNDSCLYSDTGMIGLLNNGRVIVSHLYDDEHLVKVKPGSSELSVEGAFSFRESYYFTPVKFIFFRLVNITIGRFFPNLIRSILQKLYITQKPRANYRFKRSIFFEVDKVIIKDDIITPTPLNNLSVGSDATSIYVASSNGYQESMVRCPWLQAPSDLIQDAREGVMTWRREIKV